MLVKYKMKKYKFTRTLIRNEKKLQIFIVSIISR